MGWFNFFERLTSKLQDSAQVGIIIPSSKRSKKEQAWGIQDKKNFVEE